jgi:hypothetical protein
MFLLPKKGTSTLYAEDLSICGNIFPEEPIATTAPKGQKQSVNSKQGSVYIIDEDLLLLAYNGFPNLGWVQET